MATGTPMETNILTAIMVIVNKTEVALLWTKNVLLRPKPDKLKAGLYSQLFVLASLFSALSVAAAASSVILLHLLLRHRLQRSLPSSLCARSQLSQKR